ncbi:RpiB/LacA/LacB family sugar-phosphate isomerase [Candidatus Nomurabacteria bacterium]|nr:RpiB/LacA/LacB family sugar-phosphate isomerase [Candidatus Nomurabacteria bacterium]
MKIYIASDHAGFDLKQKLIPFILGLGHAVSDEGDYNSDKDDDYPDFIGKVATEVSKDSSSKGIIIGGSGEGEAICANRFKGVRAVVYYGGNRNIISLSREHNDSNILSLGARFISEEEALDAVRAWLETDFSGAERHERRIKKIDTWPK